jgi:hypothetical protein
LQAETQALARRATKAEKARASENKNVSAKLKREWQKRDQIGDPGAMQILLHSAMQNPVNIKKMLGAGIEPCLHQQHASYRSLLTNCASKDCCLGNTHISI